MQINFQTLSINPNLPPNVHWAIIDASLKDLRASIPRGSPAKPEFEFIPITETPHYQAVKSGDSSVFSRYLETYGAWVGADKEDSSIRFDELGCDFRYLAPPHERDYIVVTPVPHTDGTVAFRVLDGVHRLALLIFAGETNAPVVLCGPQNIAAARLKLFVDSFKNHFLEWYTPIVFDSQTIVHERTYPEFVERPEFLTNGERGLVRWEQSIRPHLPDLAGRCVWDIGCNVGLYSLQMSRMGAARVIGLDRGESVIQPSNPQLPRQNVVQQAWFVKRAFELKDGPIYDNVEFREADIATFDFARVDAEMIFSSCVLYHFGARFAEIVASFPARVRCVFLQTNLGHGGALGEWAAPDMHERILRQAGFARIRRHEPTGCKYPVIIGER